MIVFSCTYELLACLLMSSTVCTDESKDLVFAGIRVVDPDHKEVFIDCLPRSSFLKEEKVK